MKLWVWQLNHELILTIMLSKVGQVWMLITCKSSFTLSHCSHIVNIIIKYHVI